MSPKPLLSDDEVHEIVRLHRRGATRVDIAAQFDRHADTISAIVTGRSYRNVLHDKQGRGGKCDCPFCVIAKRSTLNLDRAHEVIFDAVCVICETAATPRVLAAAAAHGHVLCDTCDGRKG